MKNKHIKSVPNAEPKSGAIQTPNDPTQKDKTVATFVRLSKLVFGLFMIVATSAFYIQLVPLALVFSGGIIGIEPGDISLTMDVLIWIMTGIGILIPMVYFYIRWVYYLWMRFVITPTPFNLFGLTRKKHA